MKAKRPVTIPALLDGLSKLLSMLEVLERYSVEELQTVANIALRQSQSGRGALSCVDTYAVSAKIRADAGRLCSRAAYNFSFCTGACRGPQGCPVRERPAQ